MADWRILEGDCVEAMAAMPAASVDAVVCDPPYGLEFMGKNWDRLDAGLPQEAVWKGRRGAGGSAIGTDDSKPASRHHVSLGAGKKHAFKRCTICGRRQFSGTPCECPEPEWSIEYPDGAPSSSLRMQRWHEQWAREALRVLKPGGHLLAFGGTRTYHRLACAIEDAGFEIRDTIAWMYGSGFPKSLDVSKAIDKAAGAEREVVGKTARCIGPSQAGENGIGTFKESNWEASNDLTAPATPEAAQWQGWGTALKPAHEPIVVARKPLAGTVAGNVLAHGTGALNVDGCRIGYETVNGGNLADNPHLRESIKNTGSAFGGNQESAINPAGRWPANVLLDPEAAAMLDAQTDHLREGFSRNSGRNGDDHSGNAIYGARNADTRDVGYGDSGGASRFFYVAKASAAERNAGLEGFAAQPTRRHGDTGPSVNAKPNGQAPVMDRNVHPTVKPIDLMRWLVRLVTPPGGTVLDPFAGSGTTGCAAVLEGFRFVGIEREAEYAAIARARIGWWAEHPEGVELVRRLEAEAERRATADRGQLDLFG